MNPDATPRVKREIAKTYAQTIAGYSATVLLLSQLGGKVNKEDSREHNFLKMTFGNTDYDILGGLSKWIVFASRMADRDSNSSEKQFRMVRFLRGLASPSAGMAHDVIINQGKYYYRRDESGKQVLIWDDSSDETRLKSAARLVREMMIPIGVDNIISAEEKGRPASETARNSLAEALGFGVTNREDQK